MPTLGVPHGTQVEEKFYTRQVSLELTVTVNASIEVGRIDVLPLHGSIPRPLWMRTGHTDEDDTELTADKYCLLSLDPPERLAQPRAGASRDWTMVPRLRRAFCLATQAE